MKLAETKGVPLDQLTVEDLRTLHPFFEADVTQLWSYENRFVLNGMDICNILTIFTPFSAESRNSVGGTSKQRVLEQISSVRER